MSHPSQHLPLAEIVRALVVHRRRWIIPAVVCTALAVGYALVRPATWEASQALTIRDEATIDDNKAPRTYGETSEMKTAQETVLELSRSRSVLAAALVNAGPPSGYKKPSAWPTEEDIADLRDNLRISPPHGAEFGKTEVFYLQVRAESRPRALALASDICDQLEQRFQALRGAKYQSIIDELERSEKLAQANLDRTTQRLSHLEGSVGADLAELRGLQTANAANGDLRQKLLEVQNEIRFHETEVSRNEQLLDLLKSAEDDPGRFLATPNSLLSSQPGLKRLKDGLVDAQLALSNQLGTMQENHPTVRSSRTAEQEVSQQLHREIAIAIRGIEADLKLSTDRIATLKEQLGRDRARLEKLAALRAEYGTLVATSENQTALLESARRNLSEAQASQASARSVSLISRIDTPDTGTRPLGPGKAMISLVGMVGGLAIGIGLVFLTVSPTLPSHPTRTTGEVSTPTEVRREQSYSAATVASEVTQYARPVQVDPPTKPVPPPCNVAPAPTREPVVSFAAPISYPLAHGITLKQALHKLERMLPVGHGEPVESVR